MNVKPIPGEPGVYEPTIEHIQPSEFEQIGQLLARCVSGGMIVEISPTQDQGFWVWIGLLENGGEHTGIANKSGKTLWEALISAVEAAEQGVGE